MKWACGLTTVPERVGDLLPRTLQSLRAAGFQAPRLFIDGAECFTHQDCFEKLNCPMTFRWPRIGSFGNWAIGLWELYVRNPEVDRYIMFEDDLIAVKNLRIYLDQCKYPRLGYWNLYTHVPNQERLPGTIGWHQASKKGLGALALVFSRDAVQTLLQSKSFVLHSAGSDHKRRTRAQDGCVYTSMKNVGWQEYVHDPSLVQHTGEESVTGQTVVNGEQFRHSKHPLAVSFPGEDFDALTLLKERPPCETATAP